MSLLLVMIFFIARYLRKYSETATKYPGIDRLLLGGMIACAPLFILATSKAVGPHVLMWVVYAMLYGLWYMAFKRQEFFNAKPIFYSVLPYVIIAFLGDITELISHSFYRDWSDYFETARGFALLWILAMWFINRRQKKALDKEKMKALEYEKEAKITAAVKAELEVQVRERTAALTLQKEQLEKTIDELKATQAQLIQAEKMASLGELTAGIAHEIQNPLNFVNNFSEVSNELLEELQAERQKAEGERDLAIEEDILNDIKQNLEKINHHGRRADAIVKGMLQHSRKSTGQKEPTDVNALADEYLRLSYHGLRAKDKSFNATMHTSFDSTIGKINLLPQDMGRVLLNLFNNAFYAVTEKQKAAGEGYKPTVTVGTQLIKPPLGGVGVLITVADNGSGIPQGVINKIFQPFFTTKPTGQGTGLGLSLSYDIVRAHGGEIKVETKEGEGTTFVIELPVV